MPTITPLASGSTGNCCLISQDGCHILSDMGISLRRAEQLLSSLSLTMSDITAVIVSHEHSDHIRGLRTLSKKYALPIYAAEGTAAQIAAQIPEAAPHLVPFKAGDTFTVGSFTVSSFRLPHDAADPCGFRVDCSSGSCGIITDLGYVPPKAAEALSGVSSVLLESNHDTELLKMGRYPYYLKQRILSDHGHLSNEAAADFAVYLAQRGTESFTLAHISQENNLPDIAYITVKNALEAAGLYPELSVAPVEMSCRAEV